MSCGKTSADALREYLDAEQRLLEVEPVMHSVAPGEPLPREDFSIQRIELINRRKKERDEKLAIHIAHASDGVST